MVEFLRRVSSVMMLLLQLRAHAIDPAVDTELADTHNNVVESMGRVHTCEEQNYREGRKGC